VSPKAESDHLLHCSIYTLLQNGPGEKGQTCTCKKWHKITGIENIYKDHLLIIIDCVSNIAQFTACDGIQISPFVFCLKF